MPRRPSVKTIRKNFEARRNELLAACDDIKTHYYRQAFDAKEEEYSYSLLQKLADIWQDLILNYNEAKNDDEKKILYGQWIWLSSFQKILASAKKSFFFDYYDEIIRISKEYAEHFMIPGFTAYEKVAFRKDDYVPVRYVLITHDDYPENNPYIPCYCDVSRLPLNTDARKYKQTVHDLTSTQQDKAVTQWKKYQLPINEFINKKYYEI